MKAPPPDREPWLAELAEVHAKRRDDLAGVEVTGKQFDSLTPDEQRRLEQGVLRSLGIETPEKRSSPAPRRASRARALVFRSLGGLALAACLMLLLTRRNDDRLAALPLFELLPPAADATFRSPSSGEAVPAAGLPSFAAGRQLVFTLRPATRVASALQVEVHARRHGADARAQSAEPSVQLPARVVAQPGGAQQVVIDAGPAPLEAGDWQLFFFLGPPGLEPLRLSMEPLPPGWQRYEYSLTIETKGK